MKYLTNLESVKYDPQVKINKERKIYGSMRVEPGQTKYFLKILLKTEQQNSLRDLCYSKDKHVLL